MARKVLATANHFDFGERRGRKDDKTSKRVWVRTPQMHCRNGRYPFLDKLQGAWWLSAGWAGAVARYGVLLRVQLRVRQGPVETVRRMAEGAHWVVIDEMTALFSPSHHSQAPHAQALPHVHVCVCAFVSWQVQIYFR